MDSLVVENGTDTGSATHEGHSRRVLETCVLLQSASNLRSMDRFSKNDAYVRITPDLNQYESKSSVKIEETASPVWNQQFCWPRMVKSLEFNVYDVDSIPFISDRIEHIGYAVINTSVVGQHTLELVDQTNTQNIGTITITIYFLC